jgi:AcrR family transcriptional regulator
MSSKPERVALRTPKRERGRQRVAALLEAATEVFAEKGYEAATMTEIAARAGAPIGSLYQFFPAKEALADTLVQQYIDLLVGEFRALEANARSLDTPALIEGLFGLLRGHPKERAATMPLAEARMDERTRRVAFRHMARKHIGAILRARNPGLSAELATVRAVVLLQLMKAASSLTDEDGLSGRASAIRQLKQLAARYMEQSD